MLSSSAASCKRCLCDICVTTRQLVSCMAEDTDAVQTGATAGFTASQIAFFQLLADQALGGHSTEKTNEVAANAVPAKATHTTCQPQLPTCATWSSCTASCCKILDLADDVLEVVCCRLADDDSCGTSVNSGSNHVRRTVSATGVPTNQGLKDAARLAMVCRRMKTVYTGMLQQKPQLALQVEANIRVLGAKQQLVRRLTLNHQQCCLHKEVSYGIIGVLLLSGAMYCMCAWSPSYCGSALYLCATIVFSIWHVLLHTLLLGIAQRAVARLGTRKAVLLGLVAIPACAVLMSMSMRVSAQQFQMLVASTDIEEQLLALRSCKEDTNVPYYPANGVPQQGSQASNTSPFPLPARAMITDNPPVSNDSIVTYVSQVLHASLGSVNSGTSCLLSLLQPVQISSLAGIRWPLFVCHVVSSSFAWGYGVFEYTALLNSFRSQNGLI